MTLKQVQDMNLKSYIQATLINSLLKSNQIMQKEKQISTLVEFTAKTLNSMKLQYDFELSPEFLKELEEQNLVIVFGRGKDCVSFLGAIETDKEVFEEDIIYIPAKSMKSKEVHTEEIHYLKEEFELIYNDITKNEISSYRHYFGKWSFETEIPHKKFYIWDDTNVFCEGIVFSLDDLE